MLTQSRLKKVLHYNPETGIFTRLVRTANSVQVGDVAGSDDGKGYLRISVEGKAYQAHRLAFMYMDNYFPEHDVEHKNRRRNDNRWSNLVHATRSCNLQNTKIFCTNTSGFPGVNWNCGDKKWVAKACLNQKIIHLGYYTDILEAALARYTFEQQCEQWNCVQDSELVKAIKNAWPEFQF